MKFEYIEKINLTHRKLYSCVVDLNGIYITSIFDSRRNDKNDIWGDLWNRTFAEQKRKEMNSFIRSKGYDPVEYYEWDTFGYEIGCELDKIQNKYNPVLNRVKTGEPYFSGYSINDFEIPLKLKNKIKKEAIIS